MTHQDSIHIGGRFIIEAIDPQTGLVVMRQESPNLITTIGKELLAAMLGEESGYDTGLTYFEIGTGTNAPAVTDTALQTPLTRKAITREIRASNIAQFRTFYTAGQSTGNLKEVGIFGHSTATATIGTGTLFARASISLDNSAAGFDVTMAYLVTVG